MIVYLLWRLATVLARIIPLRASYVGAAAIADLVFFVWREKRENAIDNMRHVLSNADEATARRVARRSFRNYAKYLVDFIRAPKIRPEDLQGKVESVDWDAFENIRNEGKGMMFVLMHLGNWDMGAAVFSQRGYTLNVIAESFQHDKLNKTIVAARATRGMRVIPMERAALSSVRALRRNEALAILIDRPGAENGVAVRFFDGEAVLPSGPARLALRTGARVIPVGVVRLDGAADRLLPLLDLNFRFERTGDDEHDIRALTEAILRVHEGFIRRFPDQWYMFRRMWLPSSSGSPEPVLASES